MRIAIAQLNYHIGNFEGNFQLIKAAIATAREQNAINVMDEISGFGEVTQFCAGMTALLIRPSTLQTPEN